ncbi:hypothetical protein QEV68_10580 [Trueperella pyogenes]|uniref:hypothetical protein n=1 Tax=Trueperella pyogenes TaxID=1661 RepID=UPI0032543CCD
MSRYEDAGRGGRPQQGADKAKTAREASRLEIARQQQADQDLFEELPRKIGGFFREG